MPEEKFVLLRQIRFFESAFHLAESCGKYDEADQIYQMILVLADQYDG